MSVYKIMDISYYLLYDLVIDIAYLYLKKKNEICYNLKKILID